MEIKGFIGVSFSDWDGKVSSVVFLPNCNFRCPFCHNKGLVLMPETMPTIAWKQIEKYLETNRKWIDGITITGGEPTYHQDLPLLCERVKKMGFMVKVDTNGTNPAMMQRLIEKELVDYVALDIKAPLSVEKYSVATGVRPFTFLERIRETVNLLMSGVVDYEFRTTVVPGSHGIEDVQEICRAVKGCKKYALQNFKSDVETLDPKLEILKSFSRKEMDAFFLSARNVVSNVTLRG